MVECTGFPRKSESADKPLYATLQLSTGQLPMFRLDRADFRSSLASLSYLCSTNGPPASNDSTCVPLQVHGALDSESGAQAILVYSHL